MQGHRKTPPPDVEAAKERFRRGEVELDSYLESLVDAHRPKRPDEVSVVSARVEPTVAPPRDDDPDREDELEDTIEPDLPPFAALRPAPSGSPRPVGVEDSPPARRDPPAAVAAATPAPDEPGLRRLSGGRFELQERLASEGGNEVYRARDLLASRYDSRHATVRLTILGRAVAADDKSLARTLRAAARMRGLHHPNVAQVLELHRFDGDYVITSEWLDGESLAELLGESGTPARDTVRRVLSGVAAALAHAHERGIADGHIRPEDIFVTLDGRVKLVDFGLHVAEPDAEAGPASACASCEVLEGAAPAPADDIYSLACILYRMLAGAWPRAGRDALAAEFDHVEPARPPGISHAQWRVLGSALAFRRAARPGSVGELVAPFLGSPRRRGLRPLALAAALAFLATLGWFAWQARDTLRAGLATAAGERQRATPAEPAAPAIAHPARAARPVTGPAAATAPPVAGTAESAIAAATGAVPRQPVALPPTATTAGAPGAATAPAPTGAVATPAAPVAGDAATTPTSAAASPPPAALAEPPAAPTTAEPAANAAPAQPRRPAARAASPVIGFVATEQIVEPESVGYIPLKIRARGTLRAPVDVLLTPRPGAARLNEDFVLPVTRVTLEPRRPNAEVLIAVVGDGVRENVEDFRVDLSILQGEAEMGTSSVDVVLMDDD